MERIPTEKNIRATHYLSNFLVINVDDSRWNDFLFKALQYDFYDFKIWRKIVNIKAYNELLARKFGDKIPNTDYFPLYRF